MKELAVIFAVSAVGELIAWLLPLPVPGSVYGLLLMLGLLLTGVVKLSQVRDGANFLIGSMALLFVPATVGIMDSWEALRPVLVPVVVIVTVSTVLTIGGTGAITQWLARRKESRHG